MTRSKIFIAVLFIAFMNVHFSEAQWSAITNNNIWSLNSGSIGVGTTTPNIYSKFHSVTNQGEAFTFNFLAQKKSAGQNEVASIGFGVTADGSNGCIKGGIYFQRNSPTNGIGDLKFAINNVQNNLNVTIADAVMTIKNTGFVGIGTTTPSDKLCVAGGISKLTLSGIDGVYDNILKFGYKGDLESGTININRWHGIDATITAGAASANKMKFRLYGGGTSCAAPIDVMTLQGDGYVGIGTTRPDAMLTVNGTIHAKEVTVNLDILADYVFKPTYKLMPLHEVEQFVNVNSHLPEMPSAAEVTKNGLSIGEMQNKLLKKIEELTLYVIEQDKKIERLEKTQK
jgi:hypothetical protein